MQFVTLPSEIFLEVLTPLSGISLWNLSITCSEMRSHLVSLFSSEEDNCLKQLAKRWNIISIRRPTSLVDLCYLYHFYNAMGTGGRRILPDWNIIRVLKDEQKIHDEDFLLEIAEEQRESVYNIGYEIRLRLGKSLDGFKLKRGRESSLSSIRCEQLREKQMRKAGLSKTYEVPQYLIEEKKIAKRIRTLLREGKYDEASYLFGNGIYNQLILDNLREYSLRKGHLPFVQAFDTHDGWFNPIHKPLSLAIRSGNADLVRYVSASIKVTKEQLLSFWRDICRKELIQVVEIFRELVATFPKKEAKFIIHECRNICIERDSPEIYFALVGKKAIQQELQKARDLKMYHFLSYFDHTLKATL